jgi:class 3 adenylate cyclase
MLPAVLGPARRTTVLFTDIVGSTMLASRLGDQQWRERLEAHDELSRRSVDRFEGRLVKLTGDGIMATFNGPGRAIHCAVDLRAALQGIGTTVRIGLHTGEIELRHDDIGGLTVHLAARVMGEAGPGEVLLSLAVRDLLSGSDITLEARGVHVLTGVDGQWPLFAVTAL